MLHSDSQHADNSNTIQPHPHIVGQKRKPITTWKPPQRQEILSKLSEGEEYDLLIIGGGATGMAMYYES